MTVEELVRVARERRWGLITPDYRFGSDNVPVLEQTADGLWRVGYRERGVVDWEPRTYTEEEAAATVHRQLLEFYAPEELGG